MKNRTILLSGITVMLLAFGNAWAADTSTPQIFSLKPEGTQKPPKGPPKGPPKAPEIDAASGTSAIALLTGILLLVAERSRARRS